MPEDTFLGGTLYGDSFTFLMQKPDGAKVFAGVTYNDADGWRITESTALPDDAIYRHENFSSSLSLPHRMLVHVALFANDVWGVDYIYALPEDETQNEMIFFWQNWISDNAWTLQARYFGFHPWSNITAINWDTLPMHLQEAL